MFIKLYHQDPLRNFIFILHVGRYRSRVLLSLIPIPGYDLEVKVTDLEISYKSKKNCIYVYIAIPSRPFVEFCYPPTDRFRGYGYQHGIHPSICLSIIVHPIIPKNPLSYFHETLVRLLKAFGRGVRYKKDNAN